uniref:Ribosomal RNA-processing protein 7 C-terminal domain-containing protein n=1 Tax=Setaria digitata TaxID=48799 RepID=A0A915Q701_9BILA
MVTVSEKFEKTKTRREQKSKQSKKGGIRKTKITDEMRMKEKNIVPSTSSRIDDNVKTSFSIDYNSLQALRYKISEKFSSERHLFLKKDPSNTCSLTVANIPPYVIPVTLERILAELGSGRPDEIIAQRGTVTSNEITEGFYTASARFKTENAVEQALLRCEEIQCLCLSSMDIELAQNGAAKSCSEYRNSFKTVTELQENVDSYIEKHDAKILEQKCKAKKMANVPDEDGWITVTKSHYKPVPRAIVVKNKDDLLKLSKKKKRVEENIAFYSFQLKQSKLKHLEELRRKFSEDKKKLAVAKAARKFRPT